MAGRTTEARTLVAGLAAAVTLAAFAAALAGCASPSPRPTVTASPTSRPSPTNPAPSVAPVTLPGGKHAPAAALAAFNRIFLQVTAGKGYYRMSTDGGHVTFFKQAELIEMTQDAWVNSGKARYKTSMGVLFQGLMRHSPTIGTWLTHTNDDILWAAVMCLRAAAITGDRSYVTLARQAFDATYARSYSAALGGGMWGSARHKAKNTCVALPAAVAALMLYQDLHVKSYLDKAVQLYGWVLANLYDARTGAVWDHLTPQPGGGSTVDKTTWTYNQGIFIGASDLLYQVTGKRSYYRNALRTLAFTKADLTVKGILRSEVGPGSSLYVSSGGYKGMFVRWAVMFIRRHHVKGYDAWLRQNAAEVLRHANRAGLMNEDWSQQTGNGPLSAFSCSSAVVLLQWIR